jgi:multidrug efflux pump subunit AcrA (membrane-fusion protein)
MKEDPMAVLQKLKTMRKGLMPLLIVLGAIALFAILKMTKPAQPPVQVQQKVWPVTAMTVQAETLAPVISLYGTVESNALVTAAAPVAGVVASLPVKEGQAFQKGDPLVALAQADIELPYQIAKADVADTEAELRIQGLLYEANRKRLDKEKRVLKIKQDDVKRNGQLIKKDLVSKSTLDASKEAMVRQEYTVVGAQLAVEENKAKVAQLEARLEKAKANLAQAEINRERGNVIAPYDGRIAKVSVAEGDRVAANAAMVSYYGLDSLELRAKIPGFQLDKVYDAIEDGVTLAAELKLNGHAYKLPLKRLAGEATPSGLDAFFAVPATAKTARPGDLWQVNLYGQPVPNVMAVPYSALYGADRVYIVVDGQLKSVTIQNVGEVMMDGQVWAMVRGDLPDGAQVATTHLPNAINGLKVSVVE